MNLKKYSKEQFESRGRDSEAARQLADELQADVNEQIHAAVLPVFLDIVERLNSMGHQLTEYDPTIPGDITFRDEPTDSDCYLRLASTVVVSAGYGHTMTAEEIEAEIANGAL